MATMRTILTMFQCSIITFLTVPTATHCTHYAHYTFCPCHTYYDIPEKRTV